MPPVVGCRKLTTISMMPRLGVSAKYAPRVDVVQCEHVVVPGWACALAIDVLHAYGLPGLINAQRDPLDMAQLHNAINLWLT